MNLGLNGKVVLVTGGTGAIGREIIRAYIDEGATVVFTYNRAEKKAAEIMEHFGSDRCQGHKVPATDRAGIAALAKSVYDRHGRIDVLVNNAAVAEVLPLPLLDEEDWDECMDVNVKGPFIVTKEVARFMIKNTSGSIINIGSLAGERIMEVPVHYATSKAAMTGFTLALCKELSRYNIRVNCIVPGLIDGGVGLNTSERQKKQYLEYCMCGRLGRPGEVADVIAFVSSERASFINGQVITVDGGI